MAGYAAYKSGDLKKSSDFHSYALDIIKSYPKEDEKIYWLEAISYYNLSISSSLQYQRSDAEAYIIKAFEITMNHNINQLKSRIVSLYEEYFGEIELEDNQANEIIPQKLEFNFIPGALENKNNNKIVELRCETPKNRNKKSKSSKRSLSRV